MIFGLFSNIWCILNQIILITCDIFPNDLIFIGKINNKKEVLKIIFKYSKRIQL